MQATIENKIRPEYKPSCLAKILDLDSFSSNYHFDLITNNSRFAYLELEPFINDGVEFRYKIKFEKDEAEGFRYAIESPRLEDLVLTNKIGNEEAKLKLRRVGKKVFAEYFRPKHKKETRTFTLTSDEENGAVNNLELLRYIAHLREEWKEKYRRRT